MQDKDESIYSRNKHFSFERIHKSCSSNHNYSQILKKIAIEQKAVDEDCIYYQGVLSVTVDGSKYYPGELSVKVGNQNKVLGYIQLTNTYTNIEVKYNTSHHFVSILPSTKNHHSRRIYNTNNSITQLVVE